jgi:hypothetical protein
MSSAVRLVWLFRFDLVSHSGAPSSSVVTFFSASIFFLRGALGLPRFLDGLRLGLWRDNDSVCLKRFQDHAAVLIWKGVDTVKRAIIVKKFGRRQI